VDKGRRIPQLLLLAFIVATCISSLHIHLFITHA
jgi:hypothetical protein